MNVEIGAEAALFPEKEYINGIAVAVQGGLNKALAIFKTLRYEGGPDLLPRNRWIRVVSPTPLLPAEHCVNTWV
jgi:hypothetical protein